MVKVALSYGHGENTYREKHSKGVTVNGVAYSEHTHNYLVGTKVRDILRKHGVEVLEVQPPNGRDVPLSTRIKQANDWGADLYWSVHANAATPAARGWGAFYWQGSGAGLRAAQLYAKYAKEAGFPLYSGDGVIESVRGTWSEFAELRDTDMIACLTENGFMTNPQDFEYIFKGKDNYYNRMAWVHSKAILEYLGVKYDPYASGEKVKEEPLVWYDIVIGGFNQHEINAAFDKVKNSFPHWHMEKRKQ